MIQRQTSKKISALGLIVWSCCLVFYLYEFFLRTFVGTVAKSIIADLSLSAEQFALMGAAYYIIYSFMQIPVGYLTDRYGAKRTVIFAMTLCATSLLIFAVANHFLLGLFARLLMGLGSSFGFVTLLVVITNWFPPSSYAMFIGTSQFIGTLGPLLAGGPLISVLKASGLTWRSVFIRISFFGFAFAALMFFLFRNKKQAQSDDIVVVERPKRFLNQLFKLFKNKQAWLVAFYSAVTYEAIDFLGALWGTYYLEARGLPLESAGYSISLGWLGFAIGCPLTTLLSGKIKKRKPVLISCSILGLLSTILLNYFHLPLWCYPIILFCIGIAASSLNLAIVIMIEHVEISVKALALGFNNGILVLFGAIVPIATSFLINLPKNQPAVPSDFISAFTVLPAMYVASCILSIFFIKETFCRPQKGVIHLHPKQL
ncbi:MAG: hypothetical protein S4CHLAM7_13300 [Chlamydiae bacterium]|nr:hypothetical protein [Chlamydiota bacterium]